MPLRCRCREDAHKAEMGFDACTSSLNVYAPTLLRARAVSTPVATFLSASTAAACTSTVLNASSSAIAAQNGYRSVELQFITTSKFAVIQLLLV